MSPEYFSAQIRRPSSTVPLKRGFFLGGLGGLGALFDDSGVGVGFSSVGLVFLGLISPPMVPLFLEGAGPYFSPFLTTGLRGLPKVYLLAVLMLSISSLIARPAVRTPRALLAPERSALTGLILSLPALSLGVGFDPFTFLGLEGPKSFTVTFCTSLYRRTPELRRSAFLFRRLSID